MKTPLFFIAILALIVFGCEKPEQVNFDKYFSSIKNSQFKEKYRGYENKYRRNCIYSYSDPDSNHVLYKIDKNSIGIIESSDSVDTVFIKQKIRDVLKSQNEFEISGFLSNKNKFVAYFKLDNINSLPIEIRDEERRKNYGALIYYYLDFRKDELQMKIHNDLHSVKVDSNWYFYLSPAPENSNDCGNASD